MVKLEILYITYKDDLEQTNNRIKQEKFQLKNVKLTCERMKKFEEAESPLSEELFASKILLLNGQILCHLEMFNRLGHSKKLFAFISEMDTLISESSNLPTTSTLNDFQSFAKSMLLERIADLLMIQHSHHWNNSKLLLSFACYLLSYMELRQFNPMNERFKALHCLELITLQTYLAYCCDIEAIKKLILDSKLSLSFPIKISEAIDIGSSNNNFKSFLCSISPEKLEDSLAETDPTNCASKIWLLNDSCDFLNRLIWLLAFNKKLSDCSFTFLDPLLKFLPKEVEDDNLHKFNNLSLTETDVKILLLACSCWAKLTWQKDISGRTPAIYPYFLFVKPSLRFSTFWKKLITRSHHPDQPNANSFTNFISALEVSRLRREIPDLRIIDAVFKWFTNNSSSVSSVWPSHYSRVLICLIDGSLLQPTIASDKAFFPSLGDYPTTELEDSIFDNAYKWLNGSIASDISDDQKVLLNESHNSASNSSDMKEIMTFEDETSLINDKKSLIERLEDLVQKYTFEDLEIDCLADSSISSDYSLQHDFDQICGTKNELLEIQTKIDEACEKLQAGFKFPITSGNDSEELIAAFINCEIESTNRFERTLRAFFSEYSNNASVLPTIVNQAEIPTYKDYSISSSGSASLHEIKETFTPHDPKKCLGCADENSQNKALQILDCLADLPFLVSNYT